MTARSSGCALHYATEETPLGTAGSVKNAEHLLRDDTFLVISGDALTDFDLTDLVKFHHDKGALVTVCLTRVPDPLEFGITIVDDDGRVQRFLEKPTWGQVFSDTVNTGIYVMEPEVFDYVAAGESVDWSGDVFPQLVADGQPIYGYVAEGYWEDVGTHESYLRAQADVLSGRVDVDLDGFEVSPGVWVAEGADVHPDAVLKGPLYIGDYAKVEAGAELREFTVLGSNVVVKQRRVPAPRRRARQRVHRSADQPAGLRHRQEHRHHARRAGRRGRGRRRRVRHRGGGDPLGRRPDLPVQDRRGRRRRQHRRHLRVARPAHAVRPARRLRHRQRRDHPGARGAARRRLGDDPEEGRRRSPRRGTSRAPRVRSSGPSSPR